LGVCADSAAVVMRDQAGVLESDRAFGIVAANRARIHPPAAPHGCPCGAVSKV
jgi:hypothetical protein